SFLGFPRLEALAHAGEDLLGKLRDGKLALSPAITDALLHMVDAIRRMLGVIENTNSDGDDDEAELIGLLKRLADSQPSPGTLMTTNLQVEDVSAASSPDFMLSAEAAAIAEDGEAVAGDSSEIYDASVRINVELLDKLMTLAGEIVLARNQILQYSQ